MSDRPICLLLLDCDTEETTGKMQHCSFKIWAMRLQAFAYSISVTACVNYIIIGELRHLKVNIIDILA